MTTLKLAGDRGYTLEFCKCGKHPRVMPMWALLIPPRKAKP